MLPYYLSLVVVLASITTTTLALGVKNFLLALLLSSPSGLFMLLAFVALFIHGKWIDVRPIATSMLFFLYYSNLRLFINPFVQRREDATQNIPGSLAANGATNGNSFFDIFFDCIIPSYSAGSENLHRQVHSLKRQIILRRS